ncbi:MAG: cob(I)yrinic acid a,c-diamide adenosyltransferase [Nitrospirae bacterium GWC2_57_9]|nr:MAG: cob(I)yrinic acid a,c-diamide adenosyltransferase [Nitrospirae bacterium GWC2_57_9]
MNENGLIIVFTGNGKGKTSAALGIALRATGHRMYVSLVQFIKSGSATGESRAAERLAPEFEFLSRGKGFVNCCGSTTPVEVHQKAAVQALAAAGQRMHAGWDILILDEINTAVALGLIGIQDVLALIKKKAPRLHMILTGRDAHPDLIAIADMVTEMRSIKHPYDEGRPARKGIDF